MALQMTPITLESHAKLKVQSLKNYEHVLKEQLIPLIAHEFVQASSELPIIFTKDPDGESYRAAAIVGLQKHENLLVVDGKWDGLYIPAIVQHYPFAHIPTDIEKGEFVACIQEDAPQFSNDEGTPLFTDAEKPSDFLTKQLEALENYTKNTKFTAFFLKYLVDNDLIISRSLTIEIAGQDKIDINGIYMIDESKLNELPKETFEDMHKRGMLPIIYAHLASLFQFQRLIKRKTVILAKA